MKRILSLAGALLLCGEGVARDGAVEINQACADAGGCAAGDAPGFPVSLNGPGSYVLTSDLNHDPLQDGSAAIVSVGSDVTLNLNGFTLRSTFTCEIDACEAAAVQGVSGGFSERVTVRDGRIVGVSANCIWLGDHARVERVTISHCGLHGISVGPDSIIESVSVVSTGRNGLTTPSTKASTLYGASTFSDNGIRGDDFLPDLDTSVSMNARGGSPSFCGDGLCGDGRPSYYLTENLHAPSTALTACDTGYHMASIPELAYLSGGKYETRRGAQTDDSGSGPPRLIGWIRTGGASSGSSFAGIGNCDTWTNDIAGEGTVIGLTANWSVRIGLFGNALSCTQTHHVWCFED